MAAGIGPMWPCFRPCASAGSALAARQARKPLDQRRPTRKGGRRFAARETGQAEIGGALPLPLQQPLPTERQTGQTIRPSSDLKSNHTALSSFDAAQEPLLFAV